MRLLRCYSRFYPVIPAKAGIQTIAAKFATRNQVQIAASGSLLPLWEKARMRVSPRASAALRAGRPRSQVHKPTPASPLWERARVRVSRAQARLCGRDARAPRCASRRPPRVKCVVRRRPRSQGRKPINGFIARDFRLDAVRDATSAKFPGLLQAARDALEYTATGLFGSVWKLGKRSEARYG